MKKIVVVCLIAILSKAAAEPTLNCNVGPVNKVFGGAAWLVYACDDQHSVVVVTAPGSKAAPFYFMLSYAQGAYAVHGEGTGNKSATDAAYSELSALSAKQIDQLFKEAASKTK